MRVLSITSVKDEGPFLLEWLAWHRVLGVSDFVVASNDCTDGTAQLLDALDRAGVLIHLPHVPKAGRSIQWQALKLGWQHPLRKSADWLLVSDVDEFPMIHRGQHRLSDLMEALPEGTDAVALPWRLFGAAGQVAYRDIPVTGRFLHSAPARLLHPLSGTYFKSLFRPKAFKGIGVHRPEPRPAKPAFWVDGSGQALPPEVAQNENRLSLIHAPENRALVEMHHYSLRALESYLVKSQRGLPNRQHKAIDLGYWVERNFNTVENRAALALQGALATELAALKALPDVLDLHEAACAFHKARFEELVQIPEYYTLYTQCLHAAASTPLPDALAMSLYHRYQKLRPLAKGGLG